MLEGLAQSLYFERDYTTAAIHYERAYVAYREEQDALAAGRAARAIAWITGNVFGDWAVHNGWLARARTILEEAGGNRAEAAWVLILRTLSEPDAGVRRGTAPACS